MFTAIVRPKQILIMAAVVAMLSCVSMWAGFWLGLSAPKPTAPPEEIYWAKTDFDRVSAYYNGKVYTVKNDNGSLYVYECNYEHMHHHYYGHPIPINKPYPPKKAQVEERPLPKPTAEGY